MTLTTQPNDFQQFGVVRMVSLWNASLSAFRAMVGASNKSKPNSRSHSDLRDSLNWILFLISKNCRINSFRIIFSPYCLRLTVVFFLLWSLFVPSVFSMVPGNFFTMGFLVIAHVSVLQSLIFFVSCFPQFQYMSTVSFVLVSIILSLSFRVFVGHSGNILSQLKPEGSY
jgi:hypothetical protein